MKKLIFKFNLLLLKSRLVYFLVFVIIRVIITVSFYQILFAESIVYCAYPFDTWSSVYYMDNPDDLFSKSDPVDLEAASSINDAFAGQPSTKDETLVELLAQAVFNPDQEAENLYMTFLQEKKTCSSIKQAVINSLPGSDHPMFNRDTSNCTQVKLSLYIKSLDLEGTELVCLLHLITIYDLYASALERGVSETEAINNIINLSANVLHKQIKDCFTIVNQFKEDNK